MKAYIGDYVKTYTHKHIGRVYAKHHSFKDTNESDAWFNGLHPKLPETVKTEAWYSILCHPVGSVLVPESDIVNAQTTPINDVFENSWNSYYFRKEESLITKSEIEQLQRIDITGIHNGEFIELQEDREEDGSYVRWKEIEKIIDHV